MNSIQPIFPGKLCGTVSLPTSKSISARALVMSTLAGSGELSNLSDCDDTEVLREALTLRQPTIDIHAAGTAMRFATAYFATCPGETHIITGSDRMQHRPIQVLVEALRQLGAKIEYLGQEGFPPLRIQGDHLHGGRVELPANVSSQYISALLMIGPVLQEGLRLHLIGEVVSRPYIDMTVGLMKAFGAEARWSSDHELVVLPQPYTPGLHFKVEPDWSGASYWYEMVALADDSASRVVLPSLSAHSWQGDSIVEQLFRHLGVATTFENGAAVLTKVPVPTEKSLLEIDFTTCPDLAQTFVVTCAVLGQPFRFRGLQSLRIKETDRIAALQKELQKLGILLTSSQSYDEQLGQPTEILEMMAPQSINTEGNTTIDTYDDHRMAMAFAPVAMRCPGIRIEHPEVVSKSYPSFWKDLVQLGVQI